MLPPREASTLRHLPLGAFFLPTNERDRRDLAACLVARREPVQGIALVCEDVATRPVARASSSAPLLVSERTKSVGSGPADGGERSGRGEGDCVVS